MSRKSSPWFERAIKKSSRVNDCLLFNGSKTKGYGLIWDNGTNKQLHRLSYERFNGEIADNLLVRHTCDTPNCWNPNHLILGTHKDNSQDMISRGRSNYSSKPKEYKSGQSKLTEDQVKSIKSLLNSGVSLRSLAKEFSVSHVTVFKIKHNKLWPHTQLEICQ